MSLRARAGAGRPLPPLVTRSYMPHSTWPTRAGGPPPPNGRGGLLLGSEGVFRQLTARDRDQLRGARELPPMGVARVGVAIPLAHSTAAGSFRPALIDRGFRRPYYVPPIPGSASSGDGSSGDGSGGKDGGCCG